MFKHKKRISLITLVVFTLLTVLSGAAMAKDPVEKSAVANPATRAAGGGTGGGADPGELVQNDYWDENVYLTTLSVSQDGTPTYNAERRHRDHPYHGWYVKYEVHNLAGFKAGAATVSASRDIEQSDYIRFRINGGTWTDYIMDSDATRSFPVTLLTGYNKVEIKVGELIDDDVPAFTRQVKKWISGKWKWVEETNIKEERTYTVHITASDDRTISLDPTTMTLRARRAPGIVEAIIGSGEEEDEGNGSVPCSEGSPVVTWETESDLIELEPYEEDGKYFCRIIPLKRGTATVWATLSNGARDSLTVTIRGVRTLDEPEPEPAPAAQPEPPAPPALETYDVTITVGSSQAIVDGQIVQLSGNALLLGEDRVMVDYADMAKLIPGLEVTWDWQTLSVTFSKDGKELTMVLDAIPAGFEVPFINIGGRLVVPVRYVGSFFGATVDWIGDTLVVHMYK